MNSPDSATATLPRPASPPPAGRAGEWAARAVDATKVYGAGGTEIRALDRVTIGFPSGRFSAIMGPSGSGKSTLMHCLAGLDSLTSGQAYIGDVELGPLNDKQLTKLRREQIGFVFQSFNLLPTLSAADNITLPADLGGNRVDREWMEHVIEVVGLADRLTHRPSELSGGQQQRVAVARALAGKPRLIFADEPTGNLDRRAGSEILGFLRYAVDALGQTIIIVTHDPAAAAYADDVLFLADGRIVDQMSSPTQDAVLDRLKSLGS